MPSTAGRFALVKISGTATAFTDEATTTSDDQTYTISNAAKSVWSPTASIVVEESGVPTVETYTINRLTGQVKFATVDGGRGPITVTGEYLPMTTVAKAKYYTWKIEAPVLDDTTFGDTWKQNIPNILDLSGSLKRNVTLPNIFFSAIANGSAAVLEFWDDVRSPNTWALRCWAFFMKSGHDAATDTIVEGDVEFRATQDADQRVASLTKAPDF